MSVSVSERTASATGYASTRYGQEFQIMLRRNVGGARVIAVGRVPACGYPV
jgi:hypothetical protein